MQPKCPIPSVPNLDLTEPIVGVADEAAKAAAGPSQGGPAPQVIHVSDHQAQVLVAQPLHPDKSRFHRLALVALLSGTSGSASESFLVCFEQKSKMICRSGACRFYSKVVSCT